MVAPKARGRFPERRLENSLGLVSWMEKAKLRVRSLGGGRHSFGALLTIGWTLMLKVGPLARDLLDELEAEEFLAQLVRIDGIPLAVDDCLLVPCLRAEYP
jgi:hypothetical protein